MYKPHHATFFADCEVSCWRHLQSYHYHRWASGRLRGLPTFGYLSGSGLVSAQNNDKMARKNRESFHDKISWESLDHRHLWLDERGSWNDKSWRVHLHLKSASNLLPDSAVLIGILWCFLTFEVWRLIKDHSKLQGLRPVPRIQKY